MGTQTDENGGLLEPFVQPRVCYCKRLALANDGAAADDVVWNLEREVHFMECGSEVQGIFSIGVSQGEGASLLFRLFGVLFLSGRLRAG